MLRKKTGSRAGWSVPPLLRHQYTASFCLSRVWKPEPDEAVAIQAIAPRREAPLEGTPEGVAPSAAETSKEAGL